MGQLLGRGFGFTWCTLRIDWKSWRDLFHTESTKSSGHDQWQGEPIQSSLDNLAITLVIPIWIGSGLYHVRLGVNEWSRFFRWFQPRTIHTGTGHDHDFVSHREINCSIEDGPQDNTIAVRRTSVGKVSLPRPHCVVSLGKDSLNHAHRWLGTAIQQQSTTIAILHSTLGCIPQTGFINAKRPTHSPLDHQGCRVGRNSHLSCLTRG
mmetsp:Transcript_17236/g.29233  ORF Transcript_17236/g.29233 Transcript_17236/m.29233 type:complete len:207 (-) Transcript_17236:513-1133(-)